MINVVLGVTGACSIEGAAATHTMDLEELAEMVSQRLRLLQLDQLKEVCVEAKIQSGDGVNQTNNKMHRRCN